jgi:hypothetical protein
MMQSKFCSNSLQSLSDGVYKDRKKRDLNVEVKAS